MKRTKYISVLILVFGCLAAIGQTSNPQLKKIIIQMDSVYFAAYNNCDMAKQAELYTEDIEFYHDKGGLETSKDKLLKSIEDNICGKVKRVLVEGSIEVSEIPGYGAVVMGMHKFHNNQEPEAISKPSKFITIWKDTEVGWKMARVISLH
jgi:ketosteroid isomerase-like protein